MAIPWLTILKSVPWSEVIGNAPKVASGARKLWESIGQRPPAGNSADMTNSASRPDSPAGLGAELSRQRNAINDLQTQTRALSELIASLAEQNAQLIARVEENRRHLRRAFVAIGVLAAVAVVFAFRTFTG